MPLCLHWRHSIRCTNSYIVSPHGNLAFPTILRCFYYTFGCWINFAVQVIVFLALSDSFLIFWMMLMAHHYISAERSHFMIYPICSCCCCWLRRARGYCWSMSYVETLGVCRTSCPGKNTENTTVFQVGGRIIYNIDRFGFGPPFLFIIVAIICPSIWSCPLAHAELNWSGGGALQPIGQLDI